MINLPHCIRLGLLVALALTWATAPSHADHSSAAVKQESFNRDPGWEGHHNRVAPKTVKPMQQDFGYRATNVAGKAKGEIGGVIWRAPTRASYAAKIPSKTLNDKLIASGTFALTATSGSSGAFFGWFDSAMPGDGRQSNNGMKLQARMIQKGPLVESSKSKRALEVADRLIELYTAINKPNELKKWQAERAKYPANEANKK